MSKYYYITPVINVGTEEDPEYDTHLNNTTLLSTQPVLKINPETGKPYQTWALVIANGLDHRVALADTNNFVLAKGYPPVAKFSSLNQADQNSIKDKLTSIGVSLSGILGTDQWQKYIERIGSACDPNFTFDNFDIS